MIPGATSPEQVLINLKADKVKLSKKNIDEIDGAYKKLERLIKLNHNKSIREFRGLNEKFY